MKSSQALISIESHLGDQVGRLKFAVHKISRICEITKISSIYELSEQSESRGPSQSHPQEQRWVNGLSVSLLVTTESSPGQLLSQLQNIEQQANGATRCVDIDLLVYGETSCLTPQLTLPHPEMHRRPQVLIPAAEIYGDHVHPILKESLKDLTQRFARKKWGQFYSAGHSLLDF
ncbi:MAG: 2-amino-4-hydroxy-6-hydroxymethyldihydropteridine diphosphokinase [Bdellovibrionales bacterium]